MRLECLGGNIGGFYHFGLGDDSGTPSLGINLKDKLDLRKPLEENTNRLKFRLNSPSLTLKENKGKEKEHRKQGKQVGISEFGGENLEV